MQAQDAACKRQKRQLAADHFGQTAQPASLSERVLHLQGPIIE
jgi:hypothetical protein